MNVVCVWAFSVAHPHSPQFAVMEPAPSITFDTCLHELLGQSDGDVTVEVAEDRWTVGDWMSFLREKRLDMLERIKHKSFAACKVLMQLEAGA